MAITAAKPIINDMNCRRSREVVKHKRSNKTGNGATAGTMTATAIMATVVTATTTTTIIAVIIATIATTMKRTRIKEQREKAAEFQRVEKKPLSQGWKRQRLYCFWSGS